MSIDLTSYTRNRPLAVVYKWTNMINGKIYIGSTDNIGRRINEYRQSLYRKDPNPDESTINSAMDLFGFDNFLLTPLVTELENPKLRDKTYRRNVEMRYIRRYNATDPDIGYNRKNEVSMKPKKDKFAEHIKKSKGPVVSYDFNTGDVFAYWTAASAEEILGITGSMATRSLKTGKRCQDYQFFYLDYDKRYKQIKKTIEEKSVDHDTLGRRVSPLRKKSLKNYIEAVKAVNKWCEAWGYKPVDVDAILESIE